MIFRKMNIGASEIGEIILFRSTRSRRHVAIVALDSDSDDGGIASLAPVSVSRSVSFTRARRIGKNFDVKNIGIKIVLAPSHR